MRNAGCSFFICAVAFAIGGCATMNVDVRILNREYLDSLPALIARVQLADASVRAKFASNDFVRTQNTLLRYVDNWHDSSIPLDDEPQLKNSLKAKIILQFAEATKRYEEGIDAAGAARDVAREMSKERREAYVSAAAKFRAADTALIKLPSLLREIVPDSGAVNQFSNGSDPPSVATREVDGLIGRSGLLDDALASIIANAPNDQWIGDFNKTFGAGSLGNTDIAVVMQGLGDFTLKGVRVDATKITQAAFDSVEATIKVVAAVYGVPIGGSTPSTKDATATASSDSDLRGADALLRSANQKRGRQQRAFTDILRSIVRERGAITDNTARSQAIKRIKDSYDSNVTVLETIPATGN